MSMMTGLVPDEDVGFRRGGRVRMAIVNDMPSMTKQEFAEESDINNIMAQYKRTNVISHVNRYEGKYDDVTGAVDFHTAQNVLIAADAMFMSLPSTIREKFGNDPGAFLEFATKDENREAMGKMGLLKEGWNVPRENPQEVRASGGSVEKSGGSDDRKPAGVSSQEDREGGK